MSNIQATLAPAKAPSRTTVISALIVIQLLFGINYVVTKYIVGLFPPLVWASFRIIVAAALMAGVALAMRRKHPPFSREFFGPLVGYALLGSVINQGSFLIGLRHTTATNSAILNTLIPIFTLLIVTLRGQEKLTPRRGLGFAISLLGALSIRKIEEFSLSNQTMIGDLLTMLNCLSYALFLSYSKKFMEKNDRIWSTTWIFAYGSIGLTLLAMPDWVTFHWPPLSPQLLAAMFFAVFGGTVLTYFLSIWTLAYTAPSTISIFVYIQPIVATTLAWAWFGQTVNLRTAISCCLIFTGVMLAVQPPKKKTRA